MSLLMTASAGRTSCGYPISKIVSYDRARAADVAFQIAVGLRFANLIAAAVFTAIVLTVNEVLR
jgi:hypothetical protein